MSGLTFRTPTEQDYPDLLKALDTWWGDVGGANGGTDRARLLPRMFLQHFTDTSVIVEDQDNIVAFLIGFLSQARTDQAYIHFVGVAPTHRRRGIANDLYRHFCDTARRHGRQSVHAITSVSNAISQDFHRHMGFTVSDPVVNYDGRGGDRVTFALQLS
jgi:ribosomal protein S18 acetylase RimI-like enzyme